MNNGQYHINILAILFLFFLPVAQLNPQVQAAPVQAVSCSTSSPVSGAYHATLCISTPADGSTISGDVKVAATITTTGKNPGVQRMVFDLNGSYLLTDYQDGYTFVLPTTKWIDGKYILTASAKMRDGFTTPDATVTLIFNNGISEPPVNTPDQFQPATGTQPANGAPFVVVATGDGASGETNSTKVTDFIASLNPNLFLYLGDVYEKGTFTEFYNWYGLEGTSFGRFRSITDPTVGNHEYSSNGTATGYFGYWKNIPNYYSFDAGGWHFVSLNSNSAYLRVDNTSDEYTWLANDLANHPSTCTIVYYHHPLYNIGPEGNQASMSQIWALMVQNGVSIVINGHDHDYQRWVPLDAKGIPSPTGITEFVVGTGGHGLQTFKTTDSRVAYATDLNPDAFGALKLTLNSAGAIFNYINDNGAIVNSGVIPCQNSELDTQAPSTPSSLAAKVTSSNSVDLSWLASSDNAGVNGYTVYRNNVSLATVPSNTLIYTDTTAAPATAYSYTVDAYDPAGNHSNKSSPANVTTLVAPLTKTYSVVADTYVNAASPKSNYGGAATFRVDSTPDVHAYLRFNLLGLANKPIAHARLRIYTISSSKQGISVLSVASNRWEERGVTYTGAPALGSVLATSGPITAGSWVTLDVTPYITGPDTFIFGITTTSKTSLSFQARGSGPDAAQLIIEFR